MLRVISLCLLFARGYGLFINGCPLYGCRPSGAFSSYLSGPRTRASVAWTTDFVFDPVPSALGCCANGYNVICQSNGPLPEDRGYMALSAANGTLMWRDKVLRYPTLPILDSVGDVTGSDGVNLVHYDVSGDLQPVVSLADMRPIYSLQLIGTDYLLIVSGNGGLAVRDTDAVPVAILFLNATVKGSKGTFIPISQPVANGDRFYVLTEFVPESNQTLTAEQHVRRLYAIDVHQRLTERITVAWFFSFGPAVNRSNRLRKHDIFPVEPCKRTDRNKPEITQTQLRKKSVHRSKADTVSVKQNLLWDVNSKSLYGILPPTDDSPHGNAGTTFWALIDGGDKFEFVFQYEFSVTHIASFESDHCASTTSKDGVFCRNFVRPIWVIWENSKIYGIHSNGQIFKSIDLGAILKTQISVTSKMSVMRSNDTDIDIAVMGIAIEQVSASFRACAKSLGIVDRNATSFVIGVDTSCAGEEGCILWMVAVPENMVVIGQIAGIPAASAITDDQLVMYVEDAGRSARIISIH